MFAQALNTGYATPFQVDNDSERQRLLAGYYEGCGELTNVFMKQVRMYGFIDRLLVIGTAGAGKSSLINLLAGKTITEVNDGTRSCAFTYDVYKIKYGQYPLEITDAIGLDTYPESDSQVQRLETLKNLIRFIKRNGRGFTCIIFVMQKGRIPDGFEQYYNTIFKYILRSLPPAVLFVNHCESDNPVDEWRSRNGEHICGNYKFDEIVCGTTIENGDLSNQLRVKRLETARTLWQTIERYLQHRKPQPIQGEPGLVHAVWNQMQCGGSTLNKKLAKKEQELINNEMSHDVIFSG